MITANEYQDTAEGYIDSAGLQNALGELAEICRCKAEHLRADWQDDTTARAWDQAARQLDRTVTTNAVRNVTPDAV